MFEAVTFEIYNLLSIGDKPVECFELLYTKLMTTTVLFQARSQDF